MVKQIVIFDGERISAATGDAVIVVLDRPVDIARGDMLVAPHQ